MMNYVLFYIVISGCGREEKIIWHKVCRGHKVKGGGNS